MIQERELTPEYAHKILSRIKPVYAYRKGKKWEIAARRKLRELLFAGNPPLHTNSNPRLDKISSNTYNLSFWSEPGAMVVGRLIVPVSKKQLPLVICLQGHALNTQGESVGLSALLGEGSTQDKKAYAARGLDFGKQAIEHGYAVLALEQRGFGLRADKRDRNTQAHYGGRCHNPAMGALLYGRTIIGERGHDVQTAISVMAKLTKKYNLPINMQNIACVGHSGGGTVAYYAGALDKRISAVMTSGSICQFDNSIAVIDHCVCNYIPGIRKWFEMGDIGCLIAPRSLVIIHGKYDPNFPITSTRIAASIIRKSYIDLGFPKNLRLVECTSGHMFYPKQTWNTLRKIIQHP